MIPKTLTPIINCICQQHGRYPRAETNRSKFRKSIGADRHGYKNHGSPAIHRDRQDIAHQGIISDTLQDRWQERAEAIEKNVLTELRNTAHEQLGIKHGNTHFLPAELFAAHVLATLLVPHSHHPFLLVGQEIRIRWFVRQSEPDQNGAHGTEQALDHVHPSRRSATFIGYTGCAYLQPAFPPTPSI